VTAHDRFAVRAFTVNALDYLLKPVERERLGRAVQRLSFRLASPQRHAGRSFGRARQTRSGGILS
jgi:two-component system LytT family response regulator